MLQRITDSFFQVCKSFPSENLSDTTFLGEDISACTIELHPLEDDGYPIQDPVAAGEIEYTSGNPLTSTLVTRTMKILRQYCREFFLNCALIGRPVLDQYGSRSQSCWISLYSHVSSCNLSLID